MNHASLFSGLGGFDLAAEIVGWTNVFHCENNPFCQRILNHYWPNATTYEDIKTTDFTRHEGQIDVLTGGFPCQPFSVAGQRRGPTDDRYLWPQMLRAIQQIRPRWVIAENVTGITSMAFPPRVTGVEGETTQEGENLCRNLAATTVAHQVCEDLEAQDYEVQPLIIPACATGSLHRRDRIWFLAHSRSKRRHFRPPGESKRSVPPDKEWQTGKDQQKGITRESGPRQTHCARTSAYPLGSGLERDDRQRIQEKKGTKDNLSLRIVDGTNQNVDRRATGDRRNLARGKNLDPIHPNYHQQPTEPPFCSRDDGVRANLDGITVSKLRKESLKGYGNAVVVPLVVEIFKAIEEAEAEIASNM